MSSWREPVGERPSPEPGPATLRGPADRQRRSVGWQTCSLPFVNCWNRHTKWRWCHPASGSRTRRRLVCAVSSHQRSSLLWPVAVATTSSSGRPLGGVCPRQRVTVRLYSVPLSFDRLTPESLYFLARIEALLENSVVRPEAPFSVRHHQKVATEGAVRQHIQACLLFQGEAAHLDDIARFQEILADSQSVNVVRRGAIHRPPLRLPV